jgi:hypothetical protein
MLQDKWNWKINTRRFILAAMLILKCKKGLFTTVQIVSGTGHYLYGENTQMLTGRALYRLAWVLKRCMQ